MFFCVCAKNILKIIAFLNLDYLANSVDTCTDQPASEEADQRKLANQDIHCFSSSLCFVAFEL